MRSIRDFLHSTLPLILLVAFAPFAGCGKDDSAVELVSPPGWVLVPSGGQHAKSAAQSYIDNGGSSSCAECHGADLSGGTSKVSCFGNPSNCHHGPVAGWVATPPALQEHGAAAKRTPGSSGFASCRICHGRDFSGGGSKVSCFACHGVPAPHAPKPWRASAGSAYTHTTTVEAGNAPVCHDCHAYAGTANPNNPHPPPLPAAPGAAPGCYNGTMCHNRATHPAGWAATSPAAQPHGETAKKDGSVPGQGFPSCQPCHGNPFDGGTSDLSCFGCHGVPAPHAPRPWRASAGSAYTHTNTVEAGNAPVCHDCHAYAGTANPNNPHPPPLPAAPGAAPGCYNGTMCHNRAIHPAGWAATSPAAQPHGNEAKGTPSPTAGFASCQTCHGAGASFSGGSSGVSCYPCHGPSAPHPRQWLSTDTYRHDNTATGNAAVCAYCHRSAAGTPGCFNSTLCHGAGGVAHAVPYNDNSHYTVTLATFPGSCGACHDVSAPSAKAGPVCQACHVAASPLAAANCTSCHAVPPDGLAPAGTAYPNIAGSHSPHIALNAAGSPVGCNTCHNGLGSRTLNHYDRANARPGKDALRVPPGDIVFPAECNAKSGTAAFNAATRACSNVICHGGQATPDWQTATPNAIDVPNACLACHVSGTTQYNSYSSGSHDRHTAVFGLSASTCKRCHDVAKVNGAGHFQNLVTPAFEQPASATVLPAVGYDGNRCNPQGGGLTGCHASKKW